MGKKISKVQNPELKKDKSTGVVIDCDEITISIFPPPREHGAPHCHVRSKKIRKMRGRTSDGYPELKIFLDGSEVIIVTEGFSHRDIEVIADIIFNEPLVGEISNDIFLEMKWMELHHG